jgi:hypothetical protein
MTAPSPGPWRTGRQVHRTIYDAEDRLIGVMDRVEDARLAAAGPELLAVATRAAEQRCLCAATYSDVPQAWDPADNCPSCAARALIRRIEGAP